MPYPRYRTLFAADHAPVSIRVLKSRSAPLVLCFLQHSFKTGNYMPVLGAEKLTGLLADFLETWEPDTDDPGNLNALGAPAEERATKLLKDWVREGYLTLYTDEQGTDQHTLTPELESALDWVQSLLQKPAFVGTESRFL
ncbi:MAG TPA: DUF3375 family protein, partial [Hymenobacter sp.]